MIYENTKQAENEHKDYNLSKTLNILLKATIQSLLVEPFEVFSVPRVRQSLSLFCSKFIVAKSDYAGDDVRSFPIGS